MENAEPKQFPWRGVILAFALPVVLLIPFLSKPYHLDDTFYLYVAEQIIEQPADFYGFDISWGMLHGPAYESNKNPPGVSYMLAAVAGLLGWREEIHHTFTALCGAMLSAAIFLIARRVTPRPMLATALAVCTPAFLVSTNTVMSDVPMLMFYAWAVYLWMKGLDDRRYGLLALAAVLMGFSTLTKYFGATSILLMAAYTLAKHFEARRFDPRPYIALLIPVAMIGAYQWYANYMYGVNLLGDAAGFALDLGWSQKKFPTWAKPIGGVAFLGACTASVLFLAPLLWNWKAIAAAVLLWLAVFAAILFLDRAGFFPGRKPQGSTPIYAIQYALWIVAGMHAILLVVLDAWKHRDATSFLLVCWFAGTLVFSILVNWTINVRTMLPLVPVAAIVATRRIDARFEVGHIPLAKLAPVFAAALVLSASVLWSDFRHAVSAKTAANKFLRDHVESGRDYYFKGHWGFQYYMERGGIPAFNAQGLELGDGDRIVVPTNNEVHGRFNPQVARAFKRLSLETPASAWISTNNRRTGAGFYTHFSGAIPFVFGPAPLEEYAVYELGDYEGFAARGVSVPLEYYDVPEGMSIDDFQP